ncbi:MAG: hydroxyacid dehydrogenase [Myxococcales bacterium]|nr:hydroxyacid dehydrogenase [Myxococcales bacterium]MCB9526579.1 hydroxyacid dehydrogenase [Myxococcales bacterium]
MAHRVLIADNLPDTARTRLQAAGLEVIADASLKDDALTAALKAHKPDALVVRSTKVRAEHLAAAASLQLVVRAGAGVNTIDMTAASARGIYVCNCPGTNSVAVAELTFGHLINADRQIADNVADLRAGRWAKKTYSKAGRGLKGRTLGVIGAGNIGREVITRAKAFDMRVVAWSQSQDRAAAVAAGAEWADSPVDVAREADALTVHVALVPATRGLIGEAIFDALRPGAIFINTSRGEVVDEAALAKAVREKGLRAGLDVFHDEPASDGAWQKDLVDLPGLYGTHHIGASTQQAQEAVADEACRIIEAWAFEGKALNCVNLARETPATHLLVVRHADRVGVLAGVLDVLRQANLNVQGMENIVFEGAAAACARLQIEGTPDEAVLARLAEPAEVFDVTSVALG